MLRHRNSHLRPVQDRNLLRTAARIRGCGTGLLTKRSAALIPQKQAESWIYSPALFFYSEVLLFIVCDTEPLCSPRRLWRRFLGCRGTCDSYERMAVRGESRHIVSAEAASVQSNCLHLLSPSQSALHKSETRSLTETPFGT